MSNAPPDDETAKQLEENQESIEHQTVQATEHNESANEKKLHSGQHLQEEQPEIIYELLPISDAKTKIVHEVISEYVQKVLLLSDTKDLKEPSSNFIKKVAAITMPGYIVEFIPKNKSKPVSALELAQEAIEEENVQAPKTIEQLIISQVENLTAVINERAQKAKDLLQEISTNKETTVQVMEQMKKINANMSKPYQQALDMMNREIKLLEEEENQNIEIKEKVLNELLEKIRQSIQVIVEGKKSDPIIATRETLPYNTITETQDQVFPEKIALSYENYLTGIMIGKHGTHEYNFVFSIGGASKIKSSIQLQELKIGSSSKDVRKIVLWYYEGRQTLYGIQLFDKDEIKLLETSDDFSGYKSKETVLDEGERIIGFKSRIHNDQNAHHKDFQFVLGKIQ